MRIVRGCRALGYGVTSVATRDGGISEPVRQHVRLTPRTLLELRDGEVRAAGGSPVGGNGCRYREAVYVGAARVVFGDDEDMSSLLWELASLRDGDVDSITVTCQGES
jgi:hypothetical protein